MDKKKAQRIEKLEQLIAELPKGYISQKTIRGKIYFYHQWYENGETKSVYVPEAQALELKKQIEQRKKYKDELNDLRWRDFSIPENPNALPYVLMHLDSPVVELSFDDLSGVILEIGRVYDLNLLPVGTTTSYEAVDQVKLKEWWISRSIPASRSGIRDVLEALKLSSTTALLRKGYGLSLSDCYWVKPNGSDLSWDKINFYDNPFSEDLGEILFTGAKKDDVDLSSPDSTSVGNLKKRWKIENGKRVLIKGGSAPFRQEPFNEVLAAKICSVLGFEHVDYQLVYIDGYPYSVCEDFVDGKTEFIPAQAVLEKYPAKQDESLYSRLLRACDDLGIPEIRPALARMIALDYLIANEDRHSNNYGFLRNASTLEWIGFAPLFDNGASFGFDKLNDEIAANKGIVCKPFKSKHREQLKLVTLPTLDADVLEQLPSLASKYLAEHGDKFIDSARASAVARGLQFRVSEYEKLQKEELGKRIRESFGASSNEDSSEKGNSSLCLAKESQK